MSLLLSSRSFKYAGWRVRRFVRSWFVVIVMFQRDIIRVAETADSHYTGTAGSRIRLVQIGRFSIHLDASRMACSWSRSPRAMGATVDAW